MGQFLKYEAAALVALTLGGEREAYGELVARYKDAVYRLSLGLTRDRCAAEDIAQDAFIEGYTRLSTLAEPSKYGAWLCGIARRKCYNRVWRERRCEDFDALEQILGDDSPSPEEIVIQKETSGRVRAAIRNLSEKNRAAAKLFYLEGLPVSAAAERLGIPQGTLKRRLHDARQQLKKELYFMKEDYTPSRDFEAEVKEKIRELEKYYRLYSGKDEKTTELAKQAEELARKLPDAKARSGALASIYGTGVWRDKNEADSAVKNEGTEENRVIICHKFINDALYTGKSMEDRIKFIDETAIPQIRAMGYENGEAELLYWKSYSLFMLKRYGEAKDCINEAKRLMNRSDQYYPCLFASLKLIDTLEKNPELVKRAYIANTAECLRYKDGILVYTGQPGYSGSEGIDIERNITWYSIMYSAAKCSSLFFDLSMKPGDKVEDKNGKSTLVYVGHADGVKAGGKTFNGCLRYKLSTTDVHVYDAEIYYAENVGLIRIDYEHGENKARAELCDYEIIGGEGFMPLAPGNKWSYKNTLLSDVYRQILEYEVIYSDGEYANLAHTACVYVDEDFENNPAADSDLLISRADSYYYEGKYENTIRCLKLAVQRNTSADAAEMALFAISHFERLIDYKRKGYITLPSSAGGSEIEIKDGKAVYHETRWFLGCTAGLPRFAENRYYSVLPWRYLQILCGCLFDPRWKPGFSEDRKYNPTYSNETLSAHIEVEDGGTVSVKAGTFEKCLKVTVTSEKEGELEKNRRYYWWEYHFCGKKTFYFAPGVGVVRHDCDWGEGDLTSVCELSEYTSVATNGEYMPVYIGCSWAYDETTIEPEYTLRKTYRIAHGMGGRFFVTSDHDFTYRGTSEQYEALKAGDIAKN